MEIWAFFPQIEFLVYSEYQTVKLRTENLIWVFKKTPQPKGHEMIEKFIFCIN